MTLFEPVTLGELRLANRIVMAPLSRARADVATREPHARMVTYYAQRASAGLIVTEATHVSPFSASRPGGAAIHTAAQVSGWRRVTDAVHARGGRVVLQLYHVGRKAAAAQLPRGAPPLAPSAIAAQGDVTTPVGKRPYSMPRALETSEIPGLVVQFRTAAANAWRAGFDGVEIHAANGYLIDQFLRSATNRRTDHYGGPVENRARFLLDVVDAVARVAGAGRVGVRLSPVALADGTRDDNPRALFSYVAQALSARRVAYLHLVDDAALPAGERWASLVRSSFGGPLVLCGGFDRSSAIAAVDTAQADCIAFGTLFIANPDLVERLRIDAPLNAPRVESFRKGGDEGYIDYPTLQASPLTAGTS
jgi:N-ethylmaleimide reductase